MIPHHLRLYFHFVLARIRTQTAYRTSFLLDVASNFLITALDFSMIWLIFERFGNLADWSMWQVGFLYGIISISFGLSNMVGRGFDLFQDEIRLGTFDDKLIRPYSTFYLILVHQFDLKRLGKIGQGLIFFLMANAKLSMSWSIGKVIFLLATIVGGTCFFIGLMVVGATLCFWTVQSIEFINIFTHGGNEAGNFPISIYKDWFRRLFTFVIPLAFVNYFPTLYLLDKADPHGAPAILALISPLVGIVFLTVSSQIWRFGVSHYQSTGH